MSRWLDREEDKAEAGSIVESLSRSGSEKRERADVHSETEASFSENGRELVVVRGRSYSVRESERETLYELGRFRVAFESDLIRWVYGGRAGLARADFRALAEKGLIHKAAISSEKDFKAHVYTLSAHGRDLVQAVDARPLREREVVYAGFARPSEIGHDALVYRAFLEEARRLQAQGCGIRRVVLDYELKSKLYLRQAKERGKRPFREIQRTTAEELKLPVVEGRVVIPDLRVEYENDQGEPARVDIEVATGNYRSKHLAQKARAGFTVYDGSRMWVDGGRRLAGNPFREERTFGVGL